LTTIDPVEAAGKPCLSQCERADAHPHEREAYSGLSPALAALDARLDAKIRLDKAVDDELAPDNKGFNIEGPGSCAVVGAGEERGREIDVRTPPLAAIIL
jgi:hypothetical protein